MEDLELTLPPSPVMLQRAPSNRSGRLWMRHVPVFVMVGVLVGLVIYSMASVLLVTINFKFAVAEAVLNRFGLGVMTVLLMLAVGALAAASALMVVKLAPNAHASGLPKLIGLLEAVDEVDEEESIELGRPLLEYRAIWVKTLALLLSITSGMAIGREGPAITIGAGIGWFVADHLVVSRGVHHQPGYQDHLPQLLMVSGGSAGFAAAFQAPLGSILYLLEELVRPSGWTQKTTRAMFLASSVAALCVQGVVHLASQSARVSYNTVIIYDPSTTLDQLNWRLADVPGFFAVALLAGIVTGCVTKAGLRINKFRKSYPALQSDLAKIADATAVAMLTTLLFVLGPTLAGYCHHTPHSDDHGSNHHHHRNYVQFTCDSSDYSDMASLTLVGEEGAIVHLLARDDEWDFPLVVLVVFLLLYIPAMILALGTVVPSGSFVPTLLIGSAIGRLVGEIVAEIPGVQGTVSHPGVYATVGAAAALGGFTRCTIAVVATVAEITGDLSLIAPLMISVWIARYTAIEIAPEGYTHALLHLGRNDFHSSHSVGSRSFSPSPSDRSDSLSGGDSKFDLTPDSGPLHVGCEAGKLELPATHVSKGHENGVLTLRVEAPGTWPPEGTPSPRFNPPGWTSVAVPNTPPRPRVAVASVGKL